MSICQEKWGYDKQFSSKNEKEESLLIDEIDLDENFNTMDFETNIEEIAAYGTEEIRNPHFTI